MASSSVAGTSECQNEAASDAVSSKPWYLIMMNAGPGDCDVFIWKGNKRLKLNGKSTGPVKKAKALENDIICVSDYVLYTKRTSPNLLLHSTLSHYHHNHTDN